MTIRKVKLKNKNGDYLYPYTDNIPVASTSSAGIVQLDDCATANSNNAVTSGAMYQALSDKLAITDTALKSISDANGNNITDTYALKTELSSLKTEINNSVVHLTGNETINGVKTFTSAIISVASEDSNSVVTTVSKSKSTNGHFTLGNGLILQWGTASAGGTITLPTPFTSVNYSVVLTRVNTDTKYHGGSYIKTLTTTNFTFSGADANSKEHKWIAIGY